MLMPGTLDFWNKECWSSPECLRRTRERGRCVHKAQPTSRALFQRLFWNDLFLQQMGTCAKREEQQQVWFSPDYWQNSTTTRTGEKNEVCQPRANGIDPWSSWVTWTACVQYLQQGLNEFTSVQHTHLHKVPIDRCFMNRQWLKNSCAWRESLLFYFYVKTK